MNIRQLGKLWVWILIFVLLLLEVFIGFLNVSAAINSCITILMVLITYSWYSKIFLIGIFVNKKTNPEENYIEFHFKNLIGDNNFKIFVIKNDKNDKFTINVLDEFFDKEKCIFKIKSILLQLFNKDISKIFNAKWIKFEIFLWNGEKIVTNKYPLTYKQEILFSETKLTLSEYIVNVLCPATTKEQMLNFSRESFRKKQTEKQANLAYKLWLMGGKQINNDKRDWDEAGFLLENNIDNLIK